MTVVLPDAAAQPDDFRNLILLLSRFGEAFGFGEAGAGLLELLRAELVIGRVDSNGHLEETEVIVLPFVEQQGATGVFAKDIIPERTGRLGYALRVSPNHNDDPLTRPCGSLMKWSSLG